MSVRLLLTLSGNLELNASEQKNFTIDNQGAEIAFPFRVIKKNSHSIVIDPQGKLNEVLEYIIQELKENKFPFELDNSLDKYWHNFQFEKRKINSIYKMKREVSPAVNYLKDIFKHERKPLPYQIRGIRHALKVENDANFSVSGSGKTQTALGSFISWKKANLIDKAIVIGPASCFEPWESESMACLKDPIKIIRWSGSAVKRRKLGILLKEADLILVTYQTACNDYLLLEQFIRKYKTLLILDESHYVKNPGGVRANKIISLSPFATKRMVLTGTPAPHSFIDIWTQFSFLWPSRQLLGDLYDFIQTLGKHNNPAIVLRDKLSPFFTRTTKKELGLPPVQKTAIAIKRENIPSEQIQIIHLLELRTLAEARKLNLVDMDMDILRMWRTARVIRLLQAVSNPALLLRRLDHYKIKSELDIDTSDLLGYAEVFLTKKKISAKIKTVIDIAKLLIESGKKVVIWSWFVENIRILNELLTEYNPLMIYGEIKPYEEKEDSEAEESRERNIHDFKTKNDRPILLANPAACAESISLHKQCQHAIYLDRNFNCGQFLQSMDRIHRIGMPQGLTAVYHIPIINCAIERAVDKRLKKRQLDLYTLLNDPMPILGIDEDLWVADSGQEIDNAFTLLIKEIENEKAKESL